MFSKLKTVKSTPFSDFIRNASSGKKKRVYSEVMRKATERQLKVIKRANVGKTVSDIKTGGNYSSHP